MRGGGRGAAAWARRPVVGERRRVRSAERIGSRAGSSSGRWLDVGVCGIGWAGLGSDGRGSFTIGPQGYERGQRGNTIDVQGYEKGTSRETTFDPLRNLALVPVFFAPETRETFSPGW